MPAARSKKQNVLIPNRIELRILMYLWGFNLGKRETRSASLLVIVILFAHCDLISEKLSLGGTASMPSHFSLCYGARSDQPDVTEAVPPMKNEHQRKCPGLCAARTDFKVLTHVHKTAGIGERGFRLYLRDSRSSSSATRCSNLPASLGSRLAMRSSSTASSSSSSPPAIICNRRSRVISAFLNVP